MKTPGGRPGAFLVAGCGLLRLEIRVDDLLVVLARALGRAAAVAGCLGRRAAGALRGRLLLRRLLVEVLRELVRGLGDIFDRLLDLGGVVALLALLELLDGLLDLLLLAGRHLVAVLL